MRALITGITGFVGGHLAEHLIERGDEVVGLSSSGVWSGPSSHLAQAIRLEAFDLRVDSVESLTRLLARQRPDAVYHLAAQANPSASLSDPRETWELNLGGAMTLLEAVRASGLHPTPRVLLVGSGVCYGNPSPADLPVTERCPLRPNNPYAASKAAADLLGIQHALCWGTPVVIARPFNHAGPRQEDRYVLSSFARQVAEVERGTRPRLEVGNLEIVRDFTDVRDIVRAYRLLAEFGLPGEVYNIGTGRDISLTAMLEILRRLARRPVEVVVDPSRVRPVDQPLLLADSSKLRSHTGWQPEFKIEQTLSDMLDLWRSALDSQEDSSPS
ncbi:GDP-mannose 4,6-dehydratase [Tautonia sociabilis]|uniref:SDR family oxidoreductase n=1 Tax=Tautonia sociabilis TaxID=2080755 RepID=A0A432MH92_9BACT|nr:GDP-mannose 4,6-dehydratase [Tautonia sociabilis]RUL86171.1 SDR family oxidoreductase [Tautonia sociabilis]